MELTGKFTIRHYVGIPLSAESKSNRWFSENVFIAVCQNYNKRFLSSDDELDASELEIE